MRGKKVIGVLAFIIALTVLLKTGSSHVIDAIDNKIDSQIDKWADKK